MFSSKVNRNWPLFVTFKGPRGTIKEFRPPPKIPKYVKYFKLLGLSNMTLCFEVIKSVSKLY